LLSLVALGADATPPESVLAYATPPAEHEDASWYEKLHVPPACDRNSIF